MIPSRFPGGVDFAAIKGQEHWRYIALMSIEPVTGVVSAIA